MKSVLCMTANQGGQCLLWVISGHCRRTSEGRNSGAMVIGALRNRITVTKISDKNDNEG